MKLNRYGAGLSTLWKKTLVALSTLLGVCGDSWLLQKCQFFTEEWVLVHVD